MVRSPSLSGVGLTKGELTTLGVSWAKAVLAKSSSVEMETYASMVVVVWLSLGGCL